MSQVLLLYALIFFILGFVAGLGVAYLVAELHPAKTPATHEQPTLASPLVEPHLPPPPALSDNPAGAALPTVPPASSVSFSPPALLSMPEPVRPVSMNPVNALLRSVPAATLKEKPKTRNMAEEIDAILQEKLAVSPLAGRAIRLQAQPDHGLAVLVDRASFDGVSQVNEPAVRQLIQDAVAEWQRRAAQGG